MVKAKPRTTVQRDTVFQSRIQVIRDTVFQKQVVRDTVFRHTERVVLDTVFRHTGRCAPAPKPQSLTPQRRPASADKQSLWDEQTEYLNAKKSHPQPRKHCNRFELAKKVSPLANRVWEKFYKKGGVAYANKHYEKELHRLIAEEGKRRGCTLIH